MGLIEGQVRLPGDEPLDLCIRLRQAGSRDTWAFADRDGRFRIPFILHRDAVLEIEQPGHVKRLVELRYLEHRSARPQHGPVRIQLNTVLTPLGRGLAGAGLHERLLLTPDRSPLILERDATADLPVDPRHTPLLRDPARGTGTDPIGPVAR